MSRYVEANAFSAKLVQRAEDWRWGSLWRVQRGKEAQPPQLHPWPVAKPADWLKFVNNSPEAGETSALRRCASRGSPYGDETWTQSVAEQLGLESTLRPRGRPVKEKDS